jgi:hypothetical protein
MSDKTEDAEKPETQPATKQQEADKGFDRVRDKTQPAQDQDTAAAGSYPPGGATPTGPAGAQLGGLGAVSPAQGWGNAPSGDDEEEIEATPVLSANQQFIALLAALIFTKNSVHTVRDAHVNAKNLVKAIQASDEQEKADIAAQQQRLKQKKQAEAQAADEQQKAKKNQAA